MSWNGERFENLKTTICRKLIESLSFEDYSMDNPILIRSMDSSRLYTRFARPEDQRNFVNRLGTLMLGENRSEDSTPIIKSNRAGKKQDTLSESEEPELGGVRPGRLFIIRRLRNVLPPVIEYTSDLLSVVINTCAI